MNRFVSICAAISFGIVVASYVGCSGGGGNAGDQINIGEFASLTGIQATFGQSAHNGLKLAIDEINKKGGVLGKKINLMTEDDQSKSEEAATVVQKLVNRDKVVAVIGEVASSNTLAAAPICQHEKIPLVSPASTNPRVTQTGDYIFRVCFIDPFQGTANAKFAFQNLHATNVAVLVDSRNDYSVGLAKFFNETFRSLGGVVVEEQAYSNGDKDFAAQLTAIKAKNPQAIFVPGYYSDINLIGIQARALGITVPLLGGDGWDSPELLGGKGKDALEGCYFTTHCTMEDTSSVIQMFVKAYKEAYHSSPDAIAALGYDAGNLVAAAITRCNSTNGEKIRNEIATMVNFPGVTGAITIDKDRNASKPLVVLQIKDGQYKYFQTIQP